MQKRKRYAKEFKLEALRLMKESGKSAADVARELGIRRNQLSVKAGASYSVPFF